jgi:hypothetical protein
LIIPCLNIKILEHHALLKKNAQKNTFLITFYFLFLNMNYFNYF